jgi:glutamate 5-kinase
MSGKEIVAVKHGSSVSEEYNHIGINQAKTNSHGSQHNNLRQAGFDTIEIASGAVVEGKEKMRRLGRQIGDFTEEELAIAGTAGQIRHWEVACEPYGIAIGQVLATHAEIDDTAEGTHIIENIKSATSKGMLVVLNENNAAAIRELIAYEQGQEARKRGEDDQEADNDWLAAHTAISVGASSLLLLTNKHGFEVDNEIVPEIKVADIPDMLQYCGDPSKSGTGGMDSKLLAAGKAAEAGVDVILGNAFVDYRALLAGDLVCTRVVQ